jgi:hypothetical protein
MMLSSAAREALAGMVAPASFSVWLSMPISLVALRVTL